MEIKKLKHQSTINDLDEKNIEKRKTLIFQRIESIKKLEKLYTLDLNIKPNRKTVIETSPIGKINSSKNIIHTPFIINKNHFFSKKSISPIRIYNNNSSQNNNSNQNKLNVQSINNFSRGSIKTNTNIKLSTNHLSSWKKEFKNHKSINIMLSSKHILNNLKQLKLNQRKTINPLEIQDEDKIFYELNTSKNLNEGKKKNKIDKNKKSRNIKKDNNMFFKSGSIENNKKNILSSSSLSINVKTAYNQKNMNYRFVNDKQNKKMFNKNNNKFINNNTNDALGSNYVQIYIKKNMLKHSFENNKNFSITNQIINHKPLIYTKIKEGKINSYKN